MSRPNPTAKLPRGRALIIGVGHRYYGGFEHVHKEVTREETIESPSRSLHGGWYSAGPPRNWRHRIHERLKRKMHVPAYLRHKKIKTTERVPTGVSEIMLVDCERQAKHFRTWGQAQRACERIEAVYAGLDIKVKIKEINDERGTGAESEGS